MNVAGNTTFSNGVNFGSAVAASSTDLSRHVALWGTQYGFNVTGSTLNYITGSGASHAFNAAGTQTMRSNTTGFYVGTTFVANSTGPYGKTEGNLNVNNATYSTTLNITALGGSVDLNTLTTTAVYHQPANANAGSGTNYPVALAGLLEVYASSVMIYQRYTVYNTGEIYTRSYYNGTWYAWHLVLDTGNYSSYTIPRTGDGSLSGTFTTSGDFRAPIFYDSNDTNYYLNPNGSSRLYSMTTINRIYSNEWIQMDNYSGLYSPLNTAHFYPNDATYGSWRSRGSRNGWGGIEFSDASTTLMMNTDTYGFHYNGVGWRMYSNAGSLYAPGDIVAYWSDRRLKENLRPIGSEASEILSKLTAYRFNWNDGVEEFNIDVKPGKEEIGLIAQEVQAILPDAVTVNKSGSKLNSDGNEVGNEYLTIRWNKITPLLVQALNDTTRELNELKKLLKDKGIL